MGIISWIIFGLLAGALAKWIMPGQQGGGFVMTTLLGIAGAIVGGFVGTLLGLGTVSGFDLRSLFVAVLGAILLIAGYGLLTGKKGA